MSMANTFYLTKSTFLKTLLNSCVEVLCESTANYSF